MPQLRPQGKHVYGWSIIRENNTIYFPPDVIKEYSLKENQTLSYLLLAKFLVDFVYQN